MNESVQRTASKIIIHPAYSEQTSENDIAIIRMNKRVAVSIQLHPICLPCEKINITGQNVTVAGWGATAESNEINV